ncbi:MAG TPA: hypothetical protein VNN80_31125 [Polyangiaceae bacterium]|nr:hypothetical protein [Polyangiaceae bacterium]
MRSSRASAEANLDAEGNGAGCRRTASARGASVAVGVLALAGCSTSTVQPPAAAGSLEPELVAPSAPPLPSWRAVHVDHLDPERVAQFEAARGRWLAALRGSGLSDGRGYFIRVGASTYYTLRDFADFSELERVRAERRVAPERLRDDVARYDADSDDALVAPHHSEIWSRMPSLDYRPSSGIVDEKTFVVGRMVADQVHPGERGNPYYDAWAEVSAALQAGSYPLTVLAFTSSYGSGKVIGLWLASSEAELRAAPMEDVLARVLGPDAADALLERRSRAVHSHDELVITRRGDLDSP